jgi:hypothetical protein
MGKSETKQLTYASLFAAYLEILNRNTWGVVWKFVDLITTYYKQMACLYTRLIGIIRDPSNNQVHLHKIQRL